MARAGRDRYCGVTEIMREISAALAFHAHITMYLKPRHGRNPGFVAIRKYPFRSGFKLDITDALVVKAILVRGPSGTWVA